MGNRKNLPQPGKPNPALSLNARTFYRKKIAPPAYSGLDYQYVRSFIRHGVKEFAKGDCNTNGIESFWALFKRGYHGIYHQMSKKHLQKYVNECAFRLNRKLKTMQAVFTEVVENITETNQLGYKELTA